jgi:hypothetical protein
MYTATTSIYFSFENETVDFHIFVRKKKGDTCFEGLPTAAPLKNTFISLFSHKKRVELKINGKPTEAYCIYV